MDANVLIAEIFGTAEALDDADAITATLIVGYLADNGQLGVSGAERVALAAIAELSKTNPDMARQLIAELSGE